MPVVGVWVVICGSESQHVRVQAAQCASLLAVLTLQQQIAGLLHVSVGPVLHMQCVMQNPMHRLGTNAVSYVLWLLCCSASCRRCRCLLRLTAAAHAHHVAAWLTAAGVMIEKFSYCL
jgi:hypothetical protein